MDVRPTTKALFFEQQAFALRSSRHAATAAIDFEPLSCALSCLRVTNRNENAFWPLMRTLENASKSRLAAVESRFDDLTAKPRLFLPLSASSHSIDVSYGPTSS